MHIARITLFSTEMKSKLSSRRRSIIFCITKNNTYFIRIDVYYVLYIRIILLILYAPPLTRNLRETVDTTFIGLEVIIRFANII